MIKPNNKKSKFSIYKPDHIHKYIPRYNFNSFKNEMQHTENELISYLPLHIRKNHQGFLTTKRIFEIVYLGTAITFMTFCDRIKFIKRILSNRWILFAFKSAILFGSFGSIYKIGQNVYEEHFWQIFKMTNENYKMYKLTGNILYLNPQIIVEPQISSEFDF